MAEPIKSDYGIGRTDAAYTPVSGVVSETVIVCGPEGEQTGGSASVKDRISEKAGEVKEKVSEKVSSAYEATRAGMSQAGERIREGAATGADALRDAAASTADYTRDAMCAVRTQIQTHPLVFLGAAFGVGLLVGKLIDWERSQRSSRWW